MKIEKLAIGAVAASATATAWAHGDAMMKFKQRNQQT